MGVSGDMAACLARAQDARRRGETSPAPNMIIKDNQTKVAPMTNLGKHPLEANLMSLFKFGVQYHLCKVALFVACWSVRPKH
jgi:hypothetical protein